MGIIIRVTLRWKESFAWCPSEIMQTVWRIRKCRTELKKKAMEKEISGGREGKRYFRTIKRKQPAGNVNKNTIV